MQIVYLDLNAKHRRYTKKVPKMWLCQPLPDLIVSLRSFTVLNGIACCYCECNTKSSFRRLNQDLRCFSDLAWVRAATIFAYGQTSSGKTFTMRGVTESAIADIFYYIQHVGLPSSSCVGMGFLTVSRQEIFIDLICTPSPRLEILIS